MARFPIESPPLPLAGLQHAKSDSAAQLRPAAPAAPVELQQTLGSLHRQPIKYQFEGHKHPSRRIIAVAARLATEAFRRSGRMTAHQFNETSQLILQHHASGAEKVRMLHSASRLREPLRQYYASSQKPWMPSSVVLFCCIPARVLESQQPAAATRRVAHCQDVGMSCLPHAMQRRYEPCY